MTRRILLACGIVSSLLYVAMNVVVAGSGRRNADRQPPATRRGRFRFADAQTPHPKAAMRRGIRQAVPFLLEVSGRQGSLAA
jgi:hypothetical protein